ncbi:RNA polymerase sigma factor [Nonomuraea harbinensis]|uniref:RNA polymerase sigma factor n=1 Tax=Nonomuraea harbinensis TaxID=1286938 RepID=A0ABW1C8T8_9ACTN|nr:sigma factor [Nonomuraea harbinensis]
MIAEESGTADADLIRRSRHAPEVFAGLFDRHAPALRRYVARRLGPSLADDIVSDVFLTAFRRRHRYDMSHPDARPWLYGIAARLVSRPGHLAGRRRRRPPVRHPRPGHLPLPGHRDGLAARLPPAQGRGVAHGPAVVGDRRPPGRARLSAFTPRSTAIPTSG